MFENIGGISSEQQENLEKCWEELGLTSEEIENEKNKLSEQISNIVEQAIIDSNNEKNKLISEIEDIKNNHIQLLKAIGYDDQKIQEISEIGVSGTLRERLHETKEYVKKFKSVLDKRIKQFEKLKKELDTLFYKLGYTDESKGEFIEIGNKDLSEKRLQRFKSKVLKLEEELKERTVTFNNYKNSINEIATKINVKIPPEIQELIDNNVSSPEAFQRYQDYQNEISDIYNKRYKELQDLAIEINKYWEFLKVPVNKRNEWIDKQQYLTEQSLKTCRDELTKLKEKLLESINEYEKLVRSNYKKLNLSDEQIEEKIQEIINSVPDPEDKVQVLNAFKTEHLNMKKIMTLTDEIIKLINKRNDLINKYNECIQEQNKNNDQHVSTKIEQIKRRHNLVLPGVESNLLMDVLEYKSILNQDFIFEGQKVEDTLSDVKLSPTNLLKLKKRKSNSRKSIDSISVQSKRRSSGI